jgi:hypothetical protein
MDGVAPNEANPRHDVVFWGFVATAAFAIAIYVASNFNARWHDPWMTPRHSQSMMLWWRFGSVMGRVMLLTFPFGMTLCFSASTRRRRFFARLLTAMLLLAPLILGTPP